MGAFNWVMRRCEKSSLTANILAAAQVTVTSYFLKRHQGHSPPAVSHSSFEAPSCWPMMEPTSLSRSSSESDALALPG